MFIGGHWEKVQVLRVEPKMVNDFISEQVAVEHPAEDSDVLSEIEQALVKYALDELDGAFIISRLYKAHKGEISKYALTELAKKWELRGWLTEPEHRADPRRVTDELRGMTV